MKIYTLIVAFILAGNLFAQQRIGADLNTRLGNAHLTVQYHRVLKGSFLLTTGLGGGFHGYGANIGEESEVRNNFYHNSYPAFPDEINNSDGKHQLRGTDTYGAGFTGILGIGYFKEFKNFHGFRINVNHTFSWMRSNVKAYYRDFDQVGISTSQYRNIWHPLGAVSVELYHTIRMTGRWTFYWGGKLPYYYSLDEARYNPRKDSELFYKFLPDLSFGFTRSVGSCD